MSTSEAQKQTLLLGDVLVDELDGTKFQVHELIGCGGMGEVYRAARLSDGAPCAVKCVRRDLVQNATILLRTRFEAKAFRKISHPNVVRVHGTGVRWDNVPWMSMEWLDGFTVGEILDKKGRIPLRWAIKIVRDLCLGLHAIHEHAIHRDIKPSNVHFGFDGVTRALDLGAAKSKEANVHLTSTGFQVGTLPFMAPEQLDNTVPVDHRADLWAATVVLYILITGVHPFALGGSLPANKIKLGFSILSEPHRPLLSVLPSAPPFFGQIIDRGLAKDPEHRHRSAEELAQVLNAALDFLEVTTGHAEPLSSLVMELRGEAEPVAAQSPRLICFPPRTTEPMSPPADARPHVEQDAEPNDDAPQPRAATPIPCAVTNKVPEMPEESAPDGFSTWSRLALLPAEVEVPRVSRVATKRPPASAPAAAPAQGTPSPSGASNDVTPDDPKRTGIPAATVHELGPKGTVKMIESAATLLAKQGKTLEQVQAEARAAARSEAYDRPTPQPNVSQQGRWIVLAVALMVVALVGGSAALFLLREPAAGIGASALPKASTAPSVTADTTAAPAASTTATPTASTTAAPTASTIAAPTATATVPPSSTAVATAMVPRGAPKRLQPRGPRDPQADGASAKRPGAEPPRAPHRPFGTEQ